MRICLCIAEDDLRSWVMEELLLMTWMTEQPQFVTTMDLAAADASLFIFDGGVDAERLAAMPPHIPVIAIGLDPGIPGAQVLSAKLTSKELKLAIRQTLPRGPRVTESSLR